jgi:hypothetical protein
VDFVSAGSIVRQAAQQLGLAGAAYSDGTVITDPYSSTDQNIVRLCSLFASMGQELRGDRQWSLFREGYVFSTVQGSGLYPLPADYDRYIDQTGWNRTNRLPLGGPISAQDRAVLKALLVNVTFTVLFDILDGQFATYPDNTVLPGGFFIAYYYQSLWWVLKATRAWVAYAGGGASDPGFFSVGNIVTSNGGLWYCTAGGQGTIAPNGLGPVFNGADGLQWVLIPNWAPNVVYAKWNPGAPSATNYSLILANGSVYTCATAGTSVSSGQGPSERGSGIPDGVLGTNGAPLAGQPTWNWLQAVGTPNAGAPSVSSDIVYFDQPFAVSELKRKWRVENGWPISEDMAKGFRRARAKAESADSVGKVLALDKRAGGVPLIGSQNVPFTGFGGG